MTEEGAKTISRRRVREIVPQQQQQRKEEELQQQQQQQQQQQAINLSPSQRAKRNSQETWTDLLACWIIFMTNCTTLEKRKKRNIGIQK